MRTGIVDTLNIVLPAYNEGGNIEATIRSITAHMSNHPQIRYNIIPVNDGSADETGDIINMLAAEDSRIIPVHQVNGGYGSALRAGFVRGAETKANWTYFTDSDGQFDIRDLDTHFQRAAEGYTFIAGFREKRADPFMRRFNGKGWTVVCSLALMMPLRDVDCASKLFRTELMGDPRTLHGQGATINPELFRRAKYRNARFTQIGVNHFERKHGTQTGAKPLVIAKSFLSLARVMMTAAL